MNFHMVKPF